MKRLRILIPVLLMTFLLTGCVWFLPFLPSMLPESEPEPTELPIGSQVDTRLSGDDVYWRSKLNESRRAAAYRITFSLQAQYSDSEVSLPMDILLQTNVMLDPDSSAVNTQTSLLCDTEYFYQEYALQEYYRDEEGKLIYYYHEDETDYCYREEIPLDGQTPYLIILDYSYYGFPYPQPEEISLEPQTRIVDGREAYVLTFEQPIVNVLGYTGNPSYDAKLEKRTIPTVWYVDTETYQTIMQTASLTQVDDLIGNLLQSICGIESTAQETYAISSFSYAIDQIEFDPVQVPDIPQDVLQKAWENAGFSAS